MSKKSLLDLKPSEIEGRLIFMRVDFNVPMKEGEITDDKRIKEALPSINHILDHKGKVLIASHFGRPDGTKDEKYSLKPIAKHLERLLKKPVQMASDCIGEAVSDQVNKLKNGDVLVLENTRFYKEETENSKDFATKLLNGATLFVQEAFGAAHRAHASTEAIAREVESVAGLLVTKELETLGNAIDDPKRPFLAIIGGSKVSSKLPVLKNLLKKVDILVIGGGMTYTFLKAQGFEIGKSLCEDDKIEEANAFLREAEKSNTKLIFPLDHVTVPVFSEDAPTQIVEGNTLPEGEMGVDVGPKTIKAVTEAIESAKTVLWNGPLGVFELKPFAKGTEAVAYALASSKAMTIIGGGDSAAAINQLNLAEKMTHVSTGGGASLAFLEGESLPGIEVLKEK